MVLPKRHIYLAASGNWFVSCVEVSHGCIDPHRALPPLLWFLSALISHGQDPSKQQWNLLTQVLSPSGISFYFSHSKWASCRAYRGANLKQTLDAHPCKESSCRQWRWSELLVGWSTSPWEVLTWLLVKCTDRKVYLFFCLTQWSSFWL